MLRNKHVYKTGIYYIYKNGKSRFVRIATIGPHWIHDLPYVYMTPEEIAVKQAELDSLKERYESGKLSEEKWENLARKVHDVIPVKLVNFQHRLDLGLTKEQCIKEWKRTKATRDRVESFLAMKNHPYCVDFQFHRLGDKYLVVIIEYGPLFDASVPRSEIIGRDSLLDFHIPIKNLDKIISFDGVNVHTKIKKPHPQALDIDVPAIAASLKFRVRMRNYHPFYNRTN